MLVAVSSYWDSGCFSVPSVYNSNLSARTGITFILTKTRERRQLGKKGHRKKKEEEEKEQRLKDRKKKKRRREGMKKKDEKNPSFKFSYGFLSNASTFPLAFT